MANALILNALIQELGTNIAAFEKAIGAGATTIRNAIKRESELKLDLIEKIVSAYPQVSRQWLKTGEGAMITDTAAAEAPPQGRQQIIPIGRHAYSRLKASQYPDAYEGWKGLPMYNVPISASFIETYRDDHSFHPSYYLHDPRFKDCDFGAIVTGDSMHSEIRHGDFVMCKEVVDKRFVVFGDIYYVIATNGLETCKYLSSDPKDDRNYLLIPRNEIITPSPIPKDMILRLFKVRGIMRGY